MAATVAHRLDEDGFPFFHGDLSGLAHRDVHGEDIIAIHANGVETVRGAPLCNSKAAVLLVRGRANGPAWETHIRIRIEMMMMMCA